MCSLWAWVLIAPFAVSQCLGVPDPSGGVGVKAELPASGQCFWLIGRRLNKNTGPKGPTVSTPLRVAEPPSFMLTPPAVPAS